MNVVDKRIKQTALGTLKGTKKNDDFFNLSIRTSYEKIAQGSKAELVCGDS